jgi:hypothetical protein
LNFCPYLSLQKDVRFDRWTLAPASSFTGKWANADFERLGQRFFSRFTDHEFKPLPEASILGNVSDGVDGQLPSAEERTAIQAAIAFAVLNSNPRFTPARRYVAWHTLTSDNAELFSWPIDTEQGYVATERGSMMRSVTTGGWRITDAGLRIPCPLEVEVPKGQVIDEELLAQVYAAAQHGGEGR